MNFTAVCLCAVLFLLLERGESLRCRSGNERNGDQQVHKIMQKCRRKFFSNDTRGDRDYAMSNEDESSEDDSQSASSIDEELFFRNDNKESKTNNNSRSGGSYGRNSDDNYGQDANQGNSRRQKSTASRPNFSTPTNYSSSNDRGNGMSTANDKWSNRNEMQSQNRDNDDRRNRTECITQCFFDELSLVEHRGFPERGLVVELMTRGIQDPNLRDFIEEAIGECFHFLDSDRNNYDKCSFSSSLMSCFTDKGKERCEDWDE